MKFELSASNDDKPIMASNEELLSRALPKWPQMKVKGKNVTTEQALEIIRRTDSFFSYQSGNDHNFGKTWVQMFGIPKSDDFRSNDPEVDKNLAWDAYNKAREEWNQDWQYFGGQLNYVTNDWIASCFVGGPHGWCNMMGKIEFSYNVGKWPDVGTVMDDWIKIAHEFPFLDLGVVLMSGESCEEGNEAIVAMRVKDGRVTLQDPKYYSLKEEFGSDPVVKDTTEAFILSFAQGHAREHGIPTHILSKWASDRDNRIKSRLMNG